MAEELKSYKDELSETVARLDKVADELGDEDAGPMTKIKLASLHRQTQDLNRTIEEISGEVNIDRELQAAKSLRDEKAAIRKKAMDEEAEAQQKYESAKSKIGADIALDRSIRRQKLEEQELKNLRLQMDLRREARERAELLYSTDLANTLRRLRERELDLERLHDEVGNSYERRRLYDAIRRLRIGRVSLAEQIADYDYRAVRLASVLNAPPLYDGLCTRYYSSYYYPYYRYPYYPSYPYYY